MKQRGLALLCAALLVLLILPLRADAAGENQVYHVAVNDVLVDAETGLSAANMPVSVGGTIYVPYTTFDKNLTRVDLGVGYRQTMEGSTQTLMLYNLGGTIVFDINAQTCIDISTGKDLPMRAIIRNGRIYVPANGVCQFFGLRFSYRPTQNAGVLIRICNRDAVLSDQQFLQSAATLMQYRTDRYLQSLTPVPVTPAVPDAGELRPTPVPTQAPEEPGVPVRLAVSCTEGNDLSPLLETLGRRGVRAVFLFPPERLVSGEEQVRHVLGAGHQVGLLVDGSSLEAARASLERGARLLERLAWYHPHMAALSSTGEGVAQALREDGWVLWETTVDARPAPGARYLSISGIISRLRSHSGPAALMLDDSSVSAGGLGRLLDQLEEEACPLLPVLETGMRAASR